MITLKNEQNSTVPYRKGKFYIDESSSFSGFKTDNYWNGWECPVFVKEEAQKILQELIQGADISPFDEKNDAFIVCFAALPEEAEIFKGFDIEVEGIVQHVYGIGAFSWCWTEKK